MLFHGFVHPLKQLDIEMPQKARVAGVLRGRKGYLPKVPVPLRAGGAK